MLCWNKIFWKHTNKTDKIDVALDEGLWVEITYKPLELIHFPISTLYFKTHIHVWIDQVGSHTPEACELLHIEPEHIGPGLSSAETDQKRAFPRATGPTLSELFPWAWLSSKRREKWWETSAGPYPLFTDIPRSHWANFLFSIITSQGDLIKTEIEYHSPVWNSSVASGSLEGNSKCWHGLQGTAW